MLLTHRYQKIEKAISKMYEIIIKGCFLSTPSTSGVANTTASLSQYFCSQGRKVAAHDKLTLFYLIFLKIFLMTFLRSSYFPRYAILAKSLSPKCFRHLNKVDHPGKIFPPLKKELNLTIVKRAAQACQVGRVLDTPVLHEPF